MYYIIKIYNNLSHEKSYLGCRNLRIINATCHLTCDSELTRDEENSPSFRFIVKMKTKLYAT